MINWTLDGHCINVGMHASYTATEFIMKSEWTTKTKFTHRKSKYANDILRVTGIESFSQLEFLVRSFSICGLTRAQLQTELHLG